MIVEWLTGSKVQEIEQFEGRDDGLEDINRLMAQQDRLLDDHERLLNLIDRLIDPTEDDLDEAHACLAARQA